MNWFYAKNGEQLGPISEEELKQLFESGQISESDLVWREGLSEWVSYGSVFGAGEPVEQEEPDLAISSAADPLEQEQPAPEPAGTSEPQYHYQPEGIPIPESSGTGGQTPNAELRKQALEALKGNWGLAIGLILVAYVLAIVVSLIPILGFFAILICSGPLILGVCEFFIRVYRRAGPDFGQLFSGFQNFALGLVLYLLLFLVSMAAAMVAIIPGAILMGIGAALNQGSPDTFTPLMGVGMGLMYLVMLAVSVLLYLYFGLSFFIAVDEPEMGAVHALKKSPAMVKGKLGKFFMMYLVFFGWSMLTVLTLGLGMLIVAPYFATSLVAFYDDLKEPAAV